MNKAQLVEEVSGKVGITQKDAGDVVEAITEAITDRLKEGEKVTLVGFGTFQVMTRLIRSTYQRIIDMDYRMWQEETRARERIARGWINALGGTQEMEDPGSGEHYIVPYGPDMNYFWIKGTEIVATQLDEPPDIGFTRLREVR